MLELRTLGTLDLRDGPTGVELRSILAQPKRIGLLSYLALARPHGFHRRDKLLALFWPDTDTGHARASLRQAVHFIRHSLGEGVVQSRGDEELGLGRDVLACDALEFERGLDEGEPERSLALYGGDLLPGFYVDGAPEFERWLEAERTRLRERAVAGAWAVADARERARDAAGAVEWGRRALTLAPADDAALRRLIQLLDRLGDPDGALTLYHAGVRRLRTEYEIEPSPATIELAEEICERMRAAAAALRARAGTLPEGAAHLRAARARALAPDRSLAVLPFADLSAGRDNEYFSDGLTEEIIATLAKLRALRVISRTSVMRFKGAARDLPAIARELGVRYVLEGSVRKAGERVRVAAQLIQADCDSHLWGETYDGTTEDVFAIQERLARAIAGALRLELLPADTADRVQPVDPRIRDAYLRAWHEIWSCAGADTLERARQIAENAIEAFGEHELLLAAIGTTYWQDVNGGSCRVADFPEHLRLAREYAERAVALNPQSSAARVLLGEVHNNTARPVEATLEFHRAVRIDPCNADALMWVAYELGCGGVEDEARRVGKAAIDIDPLRGVTEWIDAVVHLMAGRFGEAVAHARRIILVESGPLWTEGLGFALAHAGKMEEAARVLEPVLGRGRTSSVYDGCLGFALNAFLGRRDAALGLLTPEVLAGAEWDDLEAWFLADGFAAIREADEAFRWWNRTVELGICAPDFLTRYDRFLAPLRGSPRFARLLARARTASDTLRAAVAREPPLELPGTARRADIGRSLVNEAEADAGAGAER